jgi:hypothetical protein
MVCMSNTGSSDVDGERWTSEGKKQASQGTISEKNDNKGHWPVFLTVFCSYV